MSDNPKIILSAFADEAANRKTAVEQMASLAALGLKYYSPRFVDVTGEGKVEHVVDLSNEISDHVAVLTDLAQLHARSAKQETAPCVFQTTGPTLFEKGQRPA